MSTPPPTNPSPPLRVVYLCTTFPLLSETFIQRELRALSRLDSLQLEIVSIWKGQPHWEGLPVSRYRLSRLLTLPFHLGWWLWHRPRPVLSLLGKLLRRRYPTSQNRQENWLGFAYALTEARRFAARPPNLFHANWATMPATAAFLLSQLLDRPFSTGAHAYDIFSGGGDALLREKIESAGFVQCSTTLAADSLRQRFGTHLPIRLLRRSLDPFPALEPFQPQLPQPLPLLTVGRLVPKKHLLFLVDILQSLKQSGLAFKATIIGDGPERGEIENRIQERGLGHEIELTGALPPEAVEEQMRRGGIFLFTGKVAPDGDRDGLPNVIPEAMAIGLPVIASTTAGPSEAITSGANGILCNPDNVGEWTEAITRLAGDPRLRESMAREARHWVEIHFDSYSNATRLREWWVGLDKRGPSDSSSMGFKPLKNP